MESWIPTVEEASVLCVAGAVSPRDGVGDPCDLRRRSGRRRAAWLLRSYARDPAWRRRTAACPRTTARLAARQPAAAAVPLTPSRGQEHSTAASCALALGR